MMCLIPDEKAGIGSQHSLLLLHFRATWGSLPFLPPTYQSFRRRTLERRESIVLLMTTNAITAHWVSFHLDPILRFSIFQTFTDQPCLEFGHNNVVFTSLLVWPPDMIYQGFHTPLIITEQVTRCQTLVIPKNWFRQVLTLLGLRKENPTTRHSWTRKQIVQDVHSDTHKGSKLWLLPAKSTQHWKHNVILL